MNTENKNLINRETCHHCGAKLDQSNPIHTKAHFIGRNNNRQIYICSGRCLEREHYAENYCNGSY